MHVLPIKLSDDLYQNLRLVSQANNTSMAEFIRSKIRKPLQNKAKTAKIKKQKQQAQITANFKKAEKLAGGFHLGQGLSPNEMNKQYDKMYKKMLP